MAEWKRSWDDRPAEPKPRPSHPNWAAEVVLPVREDQFWWSREELLRRLAEVGCTGDYADLLASLSQLPDRGDLRDLARARLRGQSAPLTAPPGWV